MKKFALFLFVLLISGLSGCALASTAQGGLTVRDAWARPASMEDNSAIYFIVDNRTNQADTLLKANCTQAGMTQVHLTQIDASGNASMSMQENVTVEAGKQLSFKPGGYHVMLMNLKQEFTPGHKVPLTLTFEKAGEIQLEVEVKEP